MHLLELPLRDFEQRVNDEILENEALEEGDDNERHDEEENGENDYGDEETKDADSSREDALADYLNADDTPDYFSIPATVMTKRPPTCLSDSKHRCMRN